LIPLSISLVIVSSFSELIPNSSGRVYFSLPIGFVSTPVPTEKADEAETGSLPDAPIAPKMI
jgi:hypothetical protein